MGTASDGKLGNLPALLRLGGTVWGPGASTDDRRHAVADFCRMLGMRIGAVPVSAVSMRGLSPRMRQTLERLLAGDSEKEAAAHLKVSRHTVHVYVKSLYKHFQVSSRGELLARCLRPRGGPSDGRQSG